MLEIDHLGKIKRGEKIEKFTIGVVGRKSGTFIGSEVLNWIDDNIVK